MWARTVSRHILISRHNVALIQWLMCGLEKGKAKGKCSKMEVMPLSRRDRSDHFHQRTCNSEILSQNFCQPQSVQGLRDPKRTHSNEGTFSKFTKNIS